MSGSTNDLGECFTCQETRMHRHGTPEQPHITKARELPIISNTSVVESASSGTDTRTGESDASETAKKWALPKALERAAAELHTQDNAITCDPIFMVQDELRTYGVDSDYGEDGHEWVDEMDSERVADETKARRLDLLHNNYRNTPEHWKRVGYRIFWENRQPFLTRKGAEEHLRINGHNYRNPRIYVESAFRNAEWQGVREFLMAENTASKNGPTDQRSRREEARKLLAEYTSLDVCRYMLDNEEEKGLLALEDSILDAMVGGGK